MDFDPEKSSLYTQYEGQYNGLTEAQRRYLISGDSGSYSPGNLEEQIEQRAQVLPDRLVNLIIDTILIESNVSLPELDDPLDEYEREINEIEHYTHRSRLGDVSEAEAIGHKIGRVTKLLLKNSFATDDGDDQFPHNELTSGFMLGYYEEDGVEISKLVSELRSGSNHFQKTITNLLKEVYEVGYPSEENYNSARNLANYLRAREVPVGDNEEVQEYLVNMVKKLARVGPAGIDFQRVKEVTDELTEDESLREINELFMNVIHDTELIVNKELNKIELSSCYRIISKNNNPTSSEVASELGRSDQTNNVTNILRKLENYYEEERKNWTNRDLVQQNNDGWTMTPYGELIRYILYDWERGGNVENPFNNKSNRERVYDLLFSRAFGHHIYTYPINSPEELSNRAERVLEEWDSEGNMTEGTLSNFPLPNENKKYSLHKIPEEHSSIDEMLEGETTIRKIEWDDSTLIQFVDTEFLKHVGQTYLWLTKSNSG
jgi:hypothetical protein